jgi:hypothetical protein
VDTSNPPPTLKDAENHLSSCLLLLSMTSSTVSQTDRHGDHHHYRRDMLTTIAELPQDVRDVIYGFHKLNLIEMKARTGHNHCHQSCSVLILMSDVLASIAVQSLSRQYPPTWQTVCQPKTQHCCCTCTLALLLGVLAVTCGQQQKSPQRQQLCHRLSASPRASVGSPRSSVRSPRAPSCAPRCLSCWR